MLGDDIPKDASVPIGDAVGAMMVSEWARGEQFADDMAPKYRVSLTSRHLTHIAEKAADRGMLHDGVVGVVKRSWPYIASSTKKVEEDKSVLEMITDAASSNGIPPMYMYDAVRSLVASDLVPMAVTAAGAIEELQLELARALLAQRRFREARIVIHSWGLGEVKVGDGVKRGKVEREPRREFSEEAIVALEASSTPSKSTTVATTHDEGGKVDMRSMGLALGRGKSDGAEVPELSSRSMRYWEPPMHRRGDLGAPMARETLESAIGVKEGKGGVGEVVQVFMVDSVEGLRVARDVLVSEARRVHASGGVLVMGVDSEWRPEGRYDARIPRLADVSEVEIDKALASRSTTRIHWPVSLLQLAVPGAAIVIDLLTLATAKKKESEGGSGEGGGGGDESTSSNVLHMSDVFGDDEMCGCGREAEEVLRDLMHEETLVKVGFGLAGDSARLLGSHPWLAAAFREMTPVVEWHDLIQVAATMVPKDAGGSEGSVESMFHQACAGDAEAVLARGLNAAVALFLGAPLRKVQQTSDWQSRPLSPAQLTYAATDAVALVALARRVARLVHPFQAARDEEGGGEGVVSSPSSSSSSPSPPLTPLRRLLDSEGLLRKTTTEVRELRKQSADFVGEWVAEFMRQRGLLKEEEEVVEEAKDVPFEFLLRGEGEEKGEVGGRGSASSLFALPRIALRVLFTPFRQDSLHTSAGPSAVEAVLVAGGLPASRLWEVPAELGGDTGTAVDAARELDVGVGAIVKSMAMSAHGRPCLVLLPGDRKIDRGKVAKLASHVHNIKPPLGKKKVSLTPPPICEREFGYSPGEFPPFGHSPEIVKRCPVFIDAALATAGPWLFPGGGSRRHCMRISFKELCALYGAVPLPREEDEGGKKGGGKATPPPPPPSLSDAPIPTSEIWEMAGGPAGRGFITSVSAGGDDSAEMADAMAQLRSSDDGGGEEGEEEVVGEEEGWKKSYLTEEDFEYNDDAEPNFPWGWHAPPGVKGGESEVDVSDFVLQLHLFRPPTFVLDSHSSRLGRWLRVLGFSLFQSPHMDRVGLLDEARRRGSIIVTRDARLARSVASLSLRSIHPLPCIYLPAELHSSTKSQLDFLSAALGLEVHADSLMSRCARCNSLGFELLKPPFGDDLKVPKHVKEHIEEIYRCRNRSCNKLFWRGHLFHQTREKFIGLIGKDGEEEEEDEEDEEEEEEEGEGGGEGEGREKWVKKE